MPQTELFGAEEPRRPAAHRERDELWDMLTCHMPPPLTRSERGRWNAAVKQLREAEVTPLVLDEACRRYRTRWPDLTMTPTAIAANLSVLLALDPAWDSYRRIAGADYSAPDPLRP